MPTEHMEGVRSLSLSQRRTRPKRLVLCGALEWNARCLLRFDGGVRITRAEADHQARHQTGFSRSRTWLGIAPSRLRSGNRRWVSSEPDHESPRHGGALLALATMAIRGREVGAERFSPNGVGTLRQELCRAICRRI